MKTIAIIEDDQTIGDLLEEVLQKEGYQVERAYSGTEAVYLLSQQRPDLALLDLMLPGLSGEEVLPHLEGIPVIVVSAKVGVDDKVKLLLGGAADYLTKPFELPELLARIQVQLRKGASPLSPVLWAGDVELDTASGQVRALVVYGRLRLLGLLGRTEDRVFPWSSIRRFGEDIILVDASARGSGHMK